MLKNYRPWGQIDWLLDHSSLTKTTFIGCLSVELRCVEAAKCFSRRYGDTVDFHFSLIKDPIANNVELTKKKVDLSTQALEDSLGFSSQIDEFELFCPPLDISDYIFDLVKSSESVVLDITCMPKRFFFIAVKAILESDVKDFLVTYSLPESYCNNEELSGDPDDLEALPFFAGTENEEGLQELLLGIGHSELGLIGALEESAKNLNLHVLFPFPPGPPSIEKNWRFMRSVQALSFKNLPVDPIRVSASNVSDAFDHMVNITNGGSQPAVLAPYGPKPMSLAMCLYAIHTNSKVVYTQPRSYSPNYSHGAGKTDDGSPATNAYWICLNGENLYFKSEEAADG